MGSCQSTKAKNGPQADFGSTHRYPKTTKSKGNSATPKSVSKKEASAVLEIGLIDDGSILTSDFSRPTTHCYSKSAVNSNANDSSHSIDLKPPTVVVIDANPYSPQSQSVSTQDSNDRGHGYEIDVLDSLTKRNQPNPFGSVRKERKIETNIASILKNPDSFSDDESNNDEEINLLFQSKDDLPRNKDKSRKSDFLINGQRESFENNHAKFEKMEQSQHRSLEQTATCSTASTNFTSPELSIQKEESLEMNKNKRDKVFTKSNKEKEDDMDDNGNEDESCLSFGSKDFEETKSLGADIFEAGENFLSEDEDFLSEDENNEAKMGPTRTAYTPVTSMRPTSSPKSSNKDGREHQFGDSLTKINPHQLSTEVSRPIKSQICHVHTLRAFEDPSDSSSTRDKKSSESHRGLSEMCVEKESLPDFNELEELSRIRSEIGKMINSKKSITPTKLVEGQNNRESDISHIDLLPGYNESEDYNLLNQSLSTKNRPFEDAGDWYEKEKYAAGQVPLQQSKLDELEELSTIRKKVENTLSGTMNLSPKSKIEALEEVELPNSKRSNVMDGRGETQPSTKLQDDFSLEINMEEQISDPDFEEIRELTRIRSEVEKFLSRKEATSPNSSLTNRRTQQKLTKTSKSGNSGDQEPHIDTSPPMIIRKTKDRKSFVPSTSPNSSHIRPRLDISSRSVRPTDKKVKNDGTPGTRKKSIPKSVGLNQSNASNAQSTTSWDRVDSPQLVTSGTSSVSSTTSSTARSTRVAPGHNYGKKKKPGSTRQSFIPKPSTAKRSLVINMHSSSTNNGLESPHSIISVDSTDLSDSGSRNKLSPRYVNSKIVTPNVTGCGSGDQDTSNQKSGKLDKNGGRKSFIPRLSPSNNLIVTSHSSESLNSLLDSPNSAISERSQEYDSIFSMASSTSRKCDIRSNFLSPKENGEPVHVVQACSAQWQFDVFSSKQGCERCLSLASEKEKEDFDIHGHHPRITLTAGGCNKSCRFFVKGKTERGVRLCQWCFHYLHKPVVDRNLENSSLLRKKVFP